MIIETIITLLLGFSAGFIAGYFSRLNDRGRKMKGNDLKCCGNCFFWEMNNYSGKKKCIRGAYSSYDAKGLCKFWEWDGVTKKMRDKMRDEEK